MKTLKIPYISGLEAMLPSDLLLALHLRGAKDVIDNAPWEENPYKPEVSFSVATSDSYLFIGFHTKGLGLKAEFSETNQPVWEDSCVEFFVADKDMGGIIVIDFIDMSKGGRLLQAHIKKLIQKNISWHCLRRCFFIPFIWDIKRFFPGCSSSGHAPGSQAFI